MKHLFLEFPRWVYWYPFRMIAERIPLGVTYPMVQMTARVGSFIPQGKFRKIHEGLEKCFPDKSQSEIKQWVFKTFENYLLNASEAFWYPKLNKEQMLKMIDYEGLDKIDAALKKSKGVILAHGHFGNEELLMPGIGYMGFKAHQLGSRWEPEVYHGYLAGPANYIRRKAFERRISYRESFPVNFHYVDKNIRPAIRCLEANDVLLFAVDGREGTKWVDLDFMGRKAQFSPGLDHLARLTGAVILPVFLVRQPNHKHKLTVHDPIVPQNDDPSSALKQFMKILESYIVRNPEQYSKVFFLINDLFKD